MSCRSETVATTVWQFCPDDIQAAGFRLRALVAARAVDEITGLPVQITTLATPDLRLAPHVVPRRAAGGVVGLAGKPARLFPDLALTPAPVPLHLAAGGYLPLDLRGALGPI